MIYYELVLLKSTSAWRVESIGLDLTEFNVRDLFYAVQAPPPKWQR